VSLKYDKNMGILHGDKCTVMISRSILLRMKIFGTKVVEKLKTNILSSITFF